MSIIFNDTKALAASLILNSGAQEGIQRNEQDAAARLADLISDGRVTIPSSLLVDTIENTEELADTDQLLLRGAWDSAVSDLEYKEGILRGPRRFPRIALNLDTATSLDDIDDIEKVVRRLLDPNVQVGTVMIDRKSRFFESASVAHNPSRAGWNWPMNVGVLGAPMLHDSLVDMAQHSNDWLDRVSRFGMVTQDNPNWDVLVLPSIGDASTMIGESAGKAEFIVTERNPHVSYEETLIYLAEIADLCGASGAAAVDRSVDWPRFMRAFVREMTHDLPVHGGVWNAIKAIEGPAPVIVGWPKQLDRMRLLSVAESFQPTRRIREVSTFEGPRDEEFWSYVQPKRMVEAVESIDFIENIAFDAETTGGVPAAEAFEALEHIADGDPARHVGAILYGPFKEHRLAAMGDRTVKIEEILETPKMLARNELHLIAVRISSDDQINRADLEFPDLEELNEVGLLDLNVRIEIDAKYCSGLIDVAAGEEYQELYNRCRQSLSRAKASKDPVAAVNLLELPKRGDSTDAVFGIVSDAEDGTIIKCRLLISLEERTIQAIDLSIPVGEGQHSLELIVVHTSFSETHELFDRKNADLGFHVFDGADGSEPRIVPLSGNNGITFNKLEGLTKVISSNLSKIAYFPEEERGWQSKALSKSLTVIAQNGVEFKSLIDQILPDGIAKFGPDGPRKISLSGPIETYVPIEYVYDGNKPDRGAQICENADQYTEKVSCQGCPNTESKKHVCPLKFWGLSRLIERAPMRPPGSDGGASSNLNCSIDKALFARADKAANYTTSANDEIAFNSALSSLCTGGVHTAENWPTWRDEVAAAQPDILFVMPHVDQESAQAVLTIGGGEGDDYLRSAVEFENADIGLTDQTQLVALLGCETTLATKSDAFVGFPARFYGQGGDMVIATLATIRGADAYPIAIHFSNLLAEQSSLGAISYSRLMMNLRRRSLIHSNPAALAVVGYGNADIKVGGSNV